MPTRRFPSSVNPNPSLLRSPHAEFRRQDPRDENPGLMQTMEDSSLRPLWRLTNMLFKVRNGMLTGCVKNLMKD